MIPLKRYYQENQKPKLEADIDEIKELIRAQQVQIAEATRAALAAANAAAAVASAIQHAAQGSLLQNVAPPQMAATQQVQQVAPQLTRADQNEELGEVPNEIKEFWKKKGSFSL